MDIGPLLPGQMPNSLNTQRMQDQMDAAQFNMSQLETEISTGQKFQIPSQDPTSATQAIQLTSLLAQNTQLDANVAAGTSLLNATDSAMASISQALNSAQGIDSTGIGSSSTATQKTALAAQVQGLLQQVVNASNSSFSGRFLFGGSLNTDPPFTITSDGSVRYSGDQQTLSTFVSAGLSQATNIDGNTALAALTPPITADLNPALTLKTQLSDLKGGQGILPGKISVTLSSPATTQTIDLSAAKTIGDVRDITSDLFITQTGFAAFAFKSLNVDGSKHVFTHDAFIDQNSVFEIITAPGHESDQGIAA